VTAAFREVPLPRILIIDDQFGRCLLGSSFRATIGDSAYRLCEADQSNLCRNLGLLRHGHDIPAEHSSIAQVTFCPAQRWDARREEIVNDAGQVLEAVRGAWQSHGARWALVLLDLRFAHGALNRHGEPTRASLFGADELLPELRREFGEDLPVVILSSSDRKELNRKVRELGALDFIQRLGASNDTSSDSRDRLEEALFLHGLLPDTSGRVLGDSLSVLKMLRSARRGARSAQTILLEGETGSGKGQLARYIHSVSDRVAAPFETFNAAHRTAELQADELFGHWPGAFTDAKDQSPGIWERANGGTVFIDEVADLDESVQARLMEPIEERRVRRLGHAPKGRPSEIALDVRVILATNRQLEGQVGVKKDFLNRINAFVVRVPSLRERKEDIPMLVAGLTRILSPRWSGQVLPTAMRSLEQHDWREGNVRELRNALARAIANNPAQDITAADLQLKEGSFSHTPQPLTIADKGEDAVTLTDLLNWNPDESSAASVRLMQADHGGVLPAVVARLVSVALQLTAVNGRANHTAAVRFLLGRDGLTTVEAKHFLRKVLSLDTRGGMVWRHFAADRSWPRTQLLEELVAELRGRERRSD
jgi:DNA-binding NtrC family response regulator